MNTHQKLVKAMRLSKARKEVIETAKDLYKENFSWTWKAFREAVKKLIELEEE